MKVNELQLLYYYNCFLFLSASLSFNQLNLSLDVMTDHIAFLMALVSVICYMFVCVVLSSQPSRDLVYPLWDVSYLR